MSHRMSSRIVIHILSCDHVVPLICTDRATEMHIINRLFPGDSNAFEPLSLSPLPSLPPL
jgi:hypothetical protein